MTETQSDRLAKVLSELVPDVTEADRELVQKELNISVATVSRYLNGDVRNNDLAVDLISFFKNRIAKREKVIN